MKISLLTNKPITDKLRFVKLIKSATNLNLLESKNICDELCQNLGKKMIIEITNMDSYNELKNNILNSFDHIQIYGLAYERDYKILKIGVGDKLEYVEFIKNYIISSKDDYILDHILSKLDKQELINIIKDINI